MLSAGNDPSRAELKLFALSKAHFSSEVALSTRTRTPGSRLKSRDGKSTIQAEVLPNWVGSVCEWCQTLVAVARARLAERLAANQPSIPQATHECLLCGSHDGRGMRLSSACTTSNSSRNRWRLAAAHPASAREKVADVHCPPITGHFPVSARPIHVFQRSKYSTEAKRLLRPSL